MKKYQIPTAELISLSIDENINEEGCGNFGNKTSTNCIEE